MLETIEHVNVRFKHACDTFISAVREKDPAVRKIKFGKAVEYHELVLEWAIFAL